MNHQKYMSYALQLAEKGRNTVFPNPMVGCVIVKNDHIIGEGYHIKAGHDHAEIIALKNAGHQAEDSTLYVTLEPCSHYGRTPPCSKALIQAKIKKVIVACQDSNPLVSGRGIQELRESGIEVIVGVLKNEAQSLNQVFFEYISEHNTQGCTHV